VTNWLRGIPFGFVIVSVRRPGGKPLSDRSQVEPRGPELDGRTVTFAAAGGGGGGGFVRGAGVGGDVGGSGSGVGVAAGAELAGAEVPRTEADVDAAGLAVGVLSDVEVAAVSHPISDTARTASATKRGCMPAIVRLGP
jgi:hypothetical protein